MLPLTSPKPIMASREEASQKPVTKTHLVPLTHSMIKTKTRRASVIYLTTSQRLNNRELHLSLIVAS